MLLQLRILLHLQHAKKADGIWVRQVRTQQRPAHGGYIRFAYRFAESAVFEGNIKNSTRSLCEENKTANCLLSVKGRWTWSWLLPCGWSTLGLSCRGWSLETRTFGRLNTGEYLVCNNYTSTLWKCFLFFFFQILITPHCVLGPFTSDAFSQIIANEGVGTLWNGTLPSLILVFNPAVQFMIYEAMKRKAGKGGRKVRGHKKCIVFSISMRWKKCNPYVSLESDPSDQVGSI